MTVIAKPPLGVMPEKLFEETRVHDLAKAINDYVEHESLNNENMNSIILWCEELLRRLDNCRFLNKKEKI